MDLRRSAEQDQLVDAFTALYAKLAAPERVRAVEPLGFDPQLWDRLLETGAVAMAVAEENGGSGATLLDLALVAEQHGRYVAPAPVVEAQVAARALARLDAPEATAVLSAAIAGDRIATMALRPAVAGRASLVPAAAIADDALVLAGDELLLVPLDGHRTPVENLGSAPLADIELSPGASPVATGSQAHEVHERAIDEWLTLTAAAVVGIGARALELGVEYAKDRTAWGVPIGSFQGISHRLADSATALDGARLLAYEAAWAATGLPARFGELAAMAFAFAYESARDATHRSLHFHGGYGFMMESDVQLFYRRARAWANVFADPARVYDRVAERRYAVAGSRS
jgi:alkylation response protein AidB-like acyl-CoA dehydrogenase